MWMRHVRTAASGLVPGLGQALAGRFVDAGLFAFAMLWIRLFLAGHAEPGERIGAFLVGAPAVTRGFATPVLVVFTALLLGLHALSAWAAWKAGAPLPSETGVGSGPETSPGPGAGKGSGEV